MKEHQDLLKFRVIKYSENGTTTTISDFPSLLQASTIADELYRQSGYTNSIVIEYDGDIIYRAKRRPLFSF